MKVPCARGPEPVCRTCASFFPGVSSQGHVSPRFQGGLGAAVRRAQTRVGQCVPEYLYMSFRDGTGRAAGQGLGHYSLCTTSFWLRSRSLKNLNLNLAFQVVMKQEKRIFYLTVSLIYSFCHGIWVSTCPLAASPLNVRSGPHYQFNTV